MSESKTEAPRFKMFFSWGGVLIALLGLIILAMGSQSMGLLLTAAGMLSWLFAKRRSRAAEEVLARVRVNSPEAATGHRSGGLSCAGVCRGEGAT